jgi:lauroyl/myristoyl acyltransferase
MGLRLNNTAAHKVAAFAAQRVPRTVASAAVSAGGTFGSLFAGDRRVIVERNIERASGRTLSNVEKRKAVARTFAAYGRYYLDSFRLPSLDAKTIDEGFTYTGFEHIPDALDQGKAPILVLPHLGGWEWAAFWLTQIHGFQVTAVVEPLEPPELFDWFKSFRESLGMQVVPVGPEAGPAIIEAINAGSIVCLLSDRSVSGAASVPVDFFGERTLLPAGPATIALRTGAPLIPVAVYFDGDKHFADVRPPVPAEREGKFRADVQRVTQDLAVELERFVRKAPEQWHVLQPGWPSDYRALGRPVPEELRDLT